MGSVYSPRAAVLRRDSFELLRYAGDLLFKLTYSYKAVQQNVSSNFFPSYET
jgi:hypothetical protein